jgi:hypothetical protein
LADKGGRPGKEAWAFPQNILLGRMGRFEAKLFLAAKILLTRQQIQYNEYLVMVNKREIHSQGENP